MEPQISHISVSPLEYVNSIKFVLDYAHFVHQLGTGNNNRTTLQPQEMHQFYSCANALDLFCPFYKMKPDIWNANKRYASDMGTTNERSEEFIAAYKGYFNLSGQLVHVIWLSGSFSLSLSLSLSIYIS